MDTLTQENSAMVVESAKRATDVHSAVERLVTALRGFKTQGTYDVSATATRVVVSRRVA